MALVSGGRSMLNPNAPLFIPAAVRQVEDFSPEWWDLVNTSAWFRDYWLNQHQGEDSFYGNDNYEYRAHDVVDLLPDSIDLGIDEDFTNMEAQFEEFIQSSETEEAKKPHLLYMDPLWESGVAVNSEALKSMSLSKSPKEKNPRSEEPAKYWGMPGKSVSPKRSPRRIQQLR